MKKKLLVVAIIAILVLTMACCFVACNPTETVVNATLLEKGFYSIKEYYAKDEPLDLNGATIKYYTDLRDPSTAQEITVTADMISGFSTATVGENKTCTLTYKDKTLTYTYSVYEPQTIDTALTNGTKYLISSVTSGETNAFIFNTANKQVTLKTYSNYPAWKADTAATTTTSTYKYEILEGGSTALNVIFNNIVYRITSVTATGFMVTSYSSGTAISGSAKKFDTTEFVEPAKAAYVSQIVDSNTNKYKAIKISEKSAEYAEEKPNKYCIAVVDNDYNLKIYLTDTLVDEADIASLTPTFTIEAENTTITSTSVVWIKSFDGRNVSVQSRKEGDHYYLHITRQGNSTSDPPIIGYIIDSFTYDTIGQDGPAA